MSTLNTIVDDEENIKKKSLTLLFLNQKNRETVKGKKYPLNDGIIVFVLQLTKVSKVKWELKDPNP